MQGWLQSERAKSARLRQSGRRVVSLVLDATFPPAHNIGGEANKAARGDGERKTPCGMTELFSHPLSQAALWFAAIFAILALSILVVRRWRGGAAEDRLSASELLTKFRELHVRGSLSEDEYRTIKTKLATQGDTTLEDRNLSS
jgi:hypothetical protein